MRVFTVAFYEIDRAYGGSEEGGWWYNTGDFLRISKVFRNESAAERYAQRANKLLSVIQRHKRDVGSVIYSGGRYNAEVYEGLPPESYPSGRPYYE